VSFRTPFFHKGRALKVRENSAVRSNKMPKATSDIEGEAIQRITAVDRGPPPQMSNTPKYLIIHGINAIGERQIFIREDAARDLSKRLKELLGEP